VESLSSCCVRELFDLHYRTPGNDEKYFIECWGSYTNPRHKFEGRVYTTTVCSFLLGIVALVVFVIRNLQLG
jgi:hypothetical protein